jgi:hypothetical protein
LVDICAVRPSAIGAVVARSVCLDAGDVIGVQSQIIAALLMKIRIAGPAAPS